MGGVVRTPIGVKSVVGAITVLVELWPGSTL